MTATILPFVRRVATTAAARATSSLAQHFTTEWATRHMPLVAAAVDMLQVDDHEFDRRCVAIGQEHGALDRLCVQLTRLAGHLRDIAAALTMTARRIQDAGAVRCGKPA